MNESDSSALGGKETSDTKREVIYFPSRNPNASDDYKRLRENSFIMKKPRNNILRRFKIVPVPLRGLRVCMTI